MSERRGESNNLLIQSLRENAKNKKHPTKHKRVAKSLEVLGYDKLNSSAFSSALTSSEVSN